jgi:ABC-type Fe3+-hydroxamate transport system substrate-binding protein
MLKGKATLLLTLFLSASSWAKVPERIVTLNPMVAEWAAEILGSGGTTKKIVASSEYSHYPERLKLLPTIGPYPNLQIETIASLKPDLVIGSLEYNRPDQLELLKKLGLRVQILPKENILNMDSWIKTLSEALGEVELGKKMILKWNRALKKLHSKKANKKKVFFLVQNQPLVSVGGESFINDVFEKVGYENIFKNLNQSYPKVSKESVLERKPELIFYFDMAKNENEWNEVQKSWKNIRITMLNGDDFSRCSLRLLKALEKLNHE